MRQCDSRETSTATRWSLVGEAQRPAHREPLHHRCGGGGDLVAGQREAVELELDALEERAVGVIGVLLEVDDVAAVGGDERRHGGDDAAAIGTGDEQHGVGHRPTLRVRRMSRDDLADDAVHGRL